MKLFFATIVFLMSVAQAEDRTTAYDIVCQSMRFESERNICTSKLRNYFYFDLHALKICAAFNFDSSKNSCLDVIGNKSFEAYEINRCAGEVFDSNKIECLRVSGEIYSPSKPPCISRSEGINELSASISELRSGRLQMADMRLNSLLEKFVNGCALVPWEKSLP